MSRKLGLTLAGLGGLLLFVAIIYDPTVGDNSYERTYILGKLQTQLMIWQLGIALVIVGALVACASAIADRLPVTEAKRERVAANNRKTSIPVNIHSPGRPTVSGDDGAQV